MAIEARNQMNNGYSVESFSRKLTVGEPLHVSVVVREPMGPLFYDHSLNANFGKIIDMTGDGVEVFKTETRGKSSLMTKETIPWDDLETDAVVRKLLANAD